MQLVMRRYRLEGADWHKFKINARMVLDAEEAGLLDKYKLKNVILTPGNVARDLKKSALLAGILFVILYFAIGINVITVFTPPMVCFLIYHQIREEVRVADLITGRDFKARSLLQLLQKEHAIRNMSAVFSNVAAQARTWQEPEVIELEPQPLFAVLENHREAA
jgi:hypothetical protein